MLIGLNRRFIFIANLKCASSAIEQTLRPYAEIALTDSSFDKHIPIRQIEERFDWIFQIIPRHDFLIFGVMRDPIDYMLSLYNSHTHVSFRIAFPLRYTGGMDFDRFLQQWCPQNPEQLMPQHTRFLDRNGAIAVNYVVGYDQLGKGLRYIASCIEAPELLRLPAVNVSKRRLRRGDLTPSQRNWIARQFAGDERFLSEFCNRPLTAQDQAVWQRLPAPAE